MPLLVSYLVTILTSILVCVPVQKSPEIVQKLTLIRPEQLRTKKPRKPEQKKKWRGPNFPGGHPPSIIGAKELNYCVRDGNRCDLLAIVTAFSVLRDCTLKIE